VSLANDSFSDEAVKHANLELTAGPYRIHFVDETEYTPGSADNVRSYDAEYGTDAEAYLSTHGVFCSSAGANIVSCVIREGGGSTTIHEHSAVVVDERCFVAVGNSVFALSLPDLSLIWKQPADIASCFGIHYCMEQNCLISHGECEIARLSLDGEVEWTAQGKDIFTQGFRLFPDRVEAVDFENQRYCIDLETGTIKET